MSFAFLSALPFLKTDIVLTSAVVHLTGSSSICESIVKKIGIQHWKFYIFNKNKIYSNMLIKYAGEENLFQPCDQTLK